MKDSWESSDPYEYFMGRWSHLVAQKFLSWIAPTIGSKWLDVGCGTGVLSQLIAGEYKPASITAIDQSRNFIMATQKRVGPLAVCKVGDAMNLPVDSSSVNIAVSGLVLNFLPDKEKALSEMKRVTIDGGTVAVYVWDYAGKMDFLKKFWDIASELDPNASRLHEGNRFGDSTDRALRELFEKSGFRNLETAPIEINTHFQSFDDYWKPFLGGQGPAPTYVQSLDESDRRNLHNILHKKLPVEPDGSILLTARAWAAKGTV